ncbi:MAG: hypothetical protein WC375_08625 [Methanomassiliicoccales archaeon]|jgi:hypothetical protein
MSKVQLIMSMSQAGEIVNAINQHKYGNGGGDLCIDISQAKNPRSKMKGILKFASPLDNDGLQSCVVRINKVVNETLSSDYVKKMEKVSEFVSQLKQVIDNMPSKISTTPIAMKRKISYPKRRANRIIMTPAIASIICSMRISGKSIDETIAHLASKGIHTVRSTIHRALKNHGLVAVRSPSVSQDKAKVKARERMVIA